MTRPARPFAAPYRASARPAASASLTTCTSRPVASVNSLSASVPIQASSMLAAECTTPWRTTPGTVTPTGPSESGNRPSSSTKTSATASGVDGDGVLIRSRSAANSPFSRSTGRALDAGAAEVDAEGEVRRHFSNLFRNRSLVAGRRGQTRPVPTQLTSPVISTGSSEANRARGARRTGRPRHCGTDLPRLDRARPGRAPGDGAPLGRCAGARRAARRRRGVGLRGRREGRRRPAGLAGGRRGRAGRGDHRRPRGPVDARLPQRRAARPGVLGPAAVPRDQHARGRRAGARRWAGRPRPTRSGSTPSWRATASTSCSAAS